MDYTLRNATEEAKFANELVAIHQQKSLLDEGIEITLGGKTTLGDISSIVNHDDCIILTVNPLETRTKHTQTRNYAFYKTAPLAQKERWNAREQFFRSKGLPVPAYEISIFFD